MGVKINGREPEYDINKMFLSRWSPRAMSGEPISKGELYSLFEAAKWAPSAFNSQPWRFLYAMRDSSSWQMYHTLLSPGNQAWTKNAASLVLIISKKEFEYNHKPSRTHSFDAGAAWMSLALQGSINGLVVHGMSGFNYDQARKDLEIPDSYDIEAMVAIGRPGKKEDLPIEQQAKEFPSQRRSLPETIIEGKYKEHRK